MSTKKDLQLCAAVLGTLIGLPGCALGNGADGAEGTTEQQVALDPPANLSVEVNSATGMTLTWDPPAGPAPTKYRILLGVNGAPESFLTHSPASSTTFSDGHLTPATEYCWEVANENAGGEISLPSNEVCTATPPQQPGPVLISAFTTSSSQVTLTWSSVFNATSYILESAQPGVPQAYFATVHAPVGPQPTVAFGAKGLTPGGPYLFWVRAVSPVGVSALSGSMFVGLPPPLSPPSLGLTGITSSQLMLAWTEVPDATFYFVEMSVGIGAPVHRATVRPPALSYVAAQLLPATGYSFTVVAATSAETSPPSNMVTTSTNAGPATPFVTLSNETSTHIVLTWESVPSAVRYYVYQQVDLAGPFTFKGTTTGTTLTAAGLTPATNYSYQVYAVDSGNTSSVSEIVTTKTLAGPLCASPTGDCAL
jgi:fibronectin type 3 domain-containing protein